MEQIRKFKKITWEDLPDYGLYSDQVVDFIDEKLISFFPETLSLSPSMINNYVKNKIIPKPVKKKYYREHLGHLMVVIVLKQTIAINRIRDGINLQKKIMDTEEGFNEFMDILENSYNNILNCLEGNDPIVYKGFEATRDNISLTLAINAFCFQTLTNYILNKGGIYNDKS